MKRMLNARAATFASLLLILGFASAWAEPPDGKDPNDKVAPLSITSISRDVARASKGSPQPRSPHVMAGDEVTVALSREPAVDRRYEARFRLSLTDAAEKPQIVHAWALDKLASSEKLAPIVRLRVPVVSRTEQTSRFVQIAEMDGDTDVVVSTPYPLQIAPPSNAIIHSISPTTLAFDSVVKVTGTGFFAPPDEIKLSVGEIEAQVVRVSPAGDWFSARVPHDKNSATRKPDESFWDALDLSGKKYDAGKRVVSLTVWGVPAEVRAADDGTPAAPIELTLRRPRGSDYRIELLAGAVTLLTGGVIAGLVYGMYRTLKRRRGLVGALLLDPETQTYSLARAQFFWWLTIIAVAYLFLFFAQGIYQGQWRFPGLQGFAITFMISLGTLLLAQATSSVKGSKGAGLVHPTPADLIVHGGVLAPERVQQVVWTALTGFGFLWILLKTYATSEGLPEIPTELLVLMGLSSAGYLGGKLARKPGPIVQRLEVAEGSVVLKIFGEHFSVSPRILVDSVEIAREGIAVLEPDPDDPNEFAKALKVTVPETTAKTKDEWYSQARLVAIINNDSQRAEWQLAMPTVTAIEVAKADENGQRVVTVSGLGIDAGAVLLVPGANEEVPLAPAAGDPPTRWTATVKSWPTAQTDVTIRTASQARVQHTWTPPATEAAAPKAEPVAPPQDQNAQIDAHRRETDNAAEQPGTADANK